MQINMLLFVNYAPFSKNAETLLLLFTFKICEKKTSITTQQTSKWQTHRVLAHFPQDSKETKNDFVS